MNLNILHLNLKTSEMKFENEPKKKKKQMLEVTGK